MKITIIGTGYVGLVSGACFAELGHDVMCVDKDAMKIGRLLSGELPIFEAGLDEIVSRNMDAGKLTFSTDTFSSVSTSEVVFIAVGTPARNDDGHADLSFVYAAAGEIAEAINGYTVIVTKSTVPVGTGDEVEAIIQRVNPSAEFAVISNPEFLKEGAAIEDFMSPDRIVVGGKDELALKILRELYDPIISQGHPFIEMDRRGAELTKYAANAFLATKISFINEIANLCEQVGTNITHVSKGIGTDSRIGDKFLEAGPGYGGSCFPKDTLALIKTAQDFGARQRVVEAVAKTNETRKQTIADRILDLMGNASGKRVALLGLTFKANTDDLRDSPAIAIINSLENAGALVTAYDPQGMKHASKIMKNVEMCRDPYDAISGADAAIVVTEWAEFKRLDLRKLKAMMRGKIFADLRNMFAVDALDAAGFVHMGIGRPTVKDTKYNGLDSNAVGKQKVPTPQFTETWVGVGVGI